MSNNHIQIRSVNDIRYAFGSICNLLVHFIASRFITKSLNILGNNFDNNIVLKDLFSDNLTKEEKYEETRVSNSEKSKDKKISHNLNSIMRLKNIRLKDTNRMVIGNLNINSLPNKCAKLQEIVLKYADIRILTETKLDDSFPSLSLWLMVSQSLIDRIGTETEVVL